MPYLMIIGRKLLGTAGIVMIAAACSTHSDASATKELTTGVDQTLTLTPAQLLATTGGATPVAFAQPTQGKISYGPAGAVVYTPNKGFSGVDDIQVTTTDAVKIYAVDTPPLATVGDVESAAAQTARRSRPSRATLTRSTASPTADPTSTAAPTTKKCCRFPTFIRRSACSRSATAA